MSGRHDQQLGTAALIATAALWGTNHTVARAVSDLVPLPALVFWRWAIGALLLSLIAAPAVLKSWPAIKVHLKDLLFSGALGVGVFSYFLLGGAYYSVVVEVGILNATTPLWVVLIAWINGVERPNPRMLAGLAVALLGTLLIVCRGNPNALIGLQFSFGNALSLLGAMTFAWFSLRVKAWAVDLDLLTITVMTAWGGVIFVMLPAYVVWLLSGGAALSSADDQMWVALAAVGYIGIGPTLIANLFYLYGVSVIGAARAAVFLYLSPVFSAALAVGFLGEHLAWFHVVGALMAISGIMSMRGSR